MHVLFDSGAAHSFIANKNVIKLSKEIKRVEKGFIIGTSFGETVETNVVQFLGNPLLSSVYPINELLILVGFLKF